MNRIKSGARFLFVAAVLLLAGRGAAQAAGKVFLNELSIVGSEGAEVYNLGPDPVNLTGWRIVGTDGFYQFVAGTILDPGEYLAVSTANIQDDIGGETSLIDFASNEQDGVNYGQEGGAPLAQAGGSLCRAPDGSADPPRSTPEDARFWTIDFTPTPGGMNNAPMANLGSSVKINEIDDTNPNGDAVEFFNPTALANPISLAGWRLTDGHNVAFLTGVIQGGDVLVLAVDTEIEITRLAYLFNDLGVRVDQVGLAGAPIQPVACIGRCPDGAGPSRGFNYATSGGGATWIPMTCTVGDLNAMSPECQQVQAVPDAIVGQGMLRLLGPNPARGGEVRCALTVPSEGWVRFDVLTAAGARVQTLLDQSLSAGVHTLQWRPDGRPAGVYFLRLSIEGKSETRAVILLH
jgi:hypothetical protein